jgi:hypothetical protein
MPIRIATWAELMSPVAQGAHGVDYDVRHDAVAAKGGVGTVFLIDIRGGLVFIPFTAPIDERTHGDRVWHAETQIRATMDGGSPHWCCLRVGRKFTSQTERDKARALLHILCDSVWREHEIRFDAGRSKKLVSKVNFKNPRRAFNCVGWCCLE